MKVRPSFIKTLLRPAQEQAFWDREKKLLPSTQLLVDWDSRVQELKKQLRFGFKVTYPPKPLVFISSSNIIFPCPGIECRGFVSGITCGTCKKIVCADCREFNGKDHSCNPIILQNIEAIKKDSRPCPKCKTNIFRIDGCNHMFCTHCRTHFDWITNKVMASSSNHHYDATQQFARNITLIESTCERQEWSLPPSAHKDIHRCLGKELQSVKHLRASLYSLEKLARIHEEHLVKIRMEFLKSNISEKKAMANLWTLEQQYEKKIAIEGLLSIFISTCIDLQHMARSMDTDSILALYKNLCVACNTSSQSITEEYGGSCVSFQCDFQSEAPFVTFSST